MPGKTNLIERFDGAYGAAMTIANQGDYSWLI